MSGDAAGGVVALSSYVDAVTGQHFWAGISQISDDGHEIVRRNPKKWGSKARTVDTAGYQAHEAKKAAPRRTSARPLAAVERTRSTRSTTTPKRAVSPSWMLPLSVSRAENEREIPDLRPDKPSTIEFVFATSSRKTSTSSKTAAKPAAGFSAPATRSRSTYFTRPDPARQRRRTWTPHSAVRARGRLRGCAPRRRHRSEGSPVFRRLACVAVPRRYEAVRSG
jgi:hypothetical protein